jgi:hypothetical protein
MGLLSELRARRLVEKTELAEIARREASGKPALAQDLNVLDESVRRLDDGENYAAVLALFERRKVLESAVKRGTKAIAAVVAARAAEVDHIIATATIVQTRKNELLALGRDVQDALADDVSARKAAAELEELKHEHRDVFDDPAVDLDAFTLKTIDTVINASDADAPVLQVTPKMLAAESARRHVIMQKAHQLGAEKHQRESAEWVARNVRNGEVIGQPGPAPRHRVACWSDAISWGITTREEAA